MNAIKFPANVAALPTSELLRLQQQPLPLDLTLSVSAELDARAACIRRRVLARCGCPLCGNQYNDFAGTEGRA